MTSFETVLAKTLYPIAWRDGDFVDVASLRAPLHGPSAQYAITLFEGLMGYPVDGGIGIVGLLEHFQRMLDAALTGDLGFNRDPATLERLIRQGMEDLEGLLRVNEARGPVYVRPTLYHDGTGSVCLGPALEGGIHLAIYLQRWDGYLKQKPQGQRVLLSEYVKASSPVAHLKCSANYGLAIPAKREACAQGYDEILFLDELGMLAEASSQNIIVDLDGCILTPPLVGRFGVPAPILPGITRRILMETIAPDLGIAIQERTIDGRLLFGPFSCQGAALCGTASEVRRIGTIGRIRGRHAAQPGRISFEDRLFERPSRRLEALIDAYAKLTRGEAYRQWLTVIHL